MERAPGVSGATDPEYTPLVPGAVCGTDWAYEEVAPSTPGASGCTMTAVAASVATRRLRRGPPRAERGVCEVVGRAISTHRRARSAMLRCVALSEVQSGDCRSGSRSEG